MYLIFTKFGSHYTKTCLNYFYSRNLDIQNRSLVMSRQMRWCQKPYLWTSSWHLFKRLRTVNTTGLSGSSSCSINATLLSICPSRSCFLQSENSTIVHGQNIVSKNTNYSWIPVLSYSSASCDCLGTIFSTFVNMQLIKSIKYCFTIVICSINMIIFVVVMLPFAFMLRFIAVNI